MTNMLAVKFRPKKFADVEGQLNVVGPIQHAIKNNNLSQALLLFGPAGTGKTTIARIIAKSINCSDQKEGEPCCVCSNCKRIEAETSVDLIEFDAATNGGIDEIRAIQAQVQAASLSSRFRVFLIDEAHMLTNQASNALLKTLEEPPKNVVFILATTEINKILATIRSRCQRHTLVPLTRNNVRAQLEKIAKTIGVDIDSQALELLCRASKGGMRDAIQGLEKAASANQGKKIGLNDIISTLNAVSFDLLFSFFTHLTNGRASSVITYIDNIVNDGIVLQTFWADFQMLLRSINIASHITDSLNLQKLIPFDEDDTKKILSVSKLIDRSISLDSWKLTIQTQNSIESIHGGRTREMIEEASLRLTAMKWKSSSKTEASAKPDDVMEERFVIPAGLSVFSGKFEAL